MVPSILFLSEVIAVVELIEVDLVNERARRSHGVEACIVFGYASARKRIKTIRALEVFYFFQKLCVWFWSLDQVRGALPRHLRDTGAVTSRDVIRLAFE